MFQLTPLSPTDARRTCCGSEPSCLTMPAPSSKASVWILPRMLYFFRWDSLFPTLDFGTLEVYFLSVSLFKIFQLSIILLCSYWVFDSCECNVNKCFCFDTVADRVEANTRHSFSCYWNIPRDTVALLVGLHLCFRNSELACDVHLQLLFIHWVICLVCNQIIV